MRSLSGAQQNEDHESIALRWAANKAQPEEEYLVAFMCSPTQFKVVRFERGNREQQIYTAEA